MQKIGELSREFRTPNTCVYNDRFFNFSFKAGALCVTEAVIDTVNRTLTSRSVSICAPLGEGALACCAVRDGVFLLVTNENDVRAALVSGLDESPVLDRVSCVQVDFKAPKEWKDQPYLACLSDDAVLLHFADCDKLWRCTLKNYQLVFKELSPNIPFDRGFGSVPVGLPGGKLFVAGGLPCSKNITEITVNDEVEFKSTESILACERTWSSAVLINGRFLVGFGGWAGYPLNDLWIFDTRIGELCSISGSGKKSDEWHPASFLVPLVVRNNVLYLLAGAWTKSVYALPLRDFSSLIRNSKIREAFVRVCFGNGLDKYTTLPTMIAPRAMPMLGEKQRKKIKELSSGRKKSKGGKASRADKSKKKSEDGDPLCDEGSPRKLIAASLFSQAEAPLTDSIRQVLTVFYPGYVLPEDSPLLELRQRDLRPMDKLLDSEKIETAGEGGRKKPPKKKSREDELSKHILTLRNGADGLQTEERCFSAATLRDVVKRSKKFYEPRRLLGKSAGIRSLRLSAVEGMESDRGEDWQGQWSTVIEG